MPCAKLAENKGLGLKIMEKDRSVLIQGGVRLTCDSYELEYDDLTSLTFQSGRIK
jgi:hypothetical protein